MPAYVFTVDGVSLLPYIAEDGIKWTRNDIESEDAGRTLDGTMQRSRITSKTRLDIKCRPLNSNEARTVLQAINPVFVTVHYIDPQEGIVTKTMYSNNVPALCSQIYEDGTCLWDGLEFPLIER